MMRVWMCGCVDVWQCSSVDVWQCMRVAVYQCGSVSMWQCGSVAVWQCISVLKVMNDELMLKEVLPAGCKCIPTYQCSSLLLVCGGVVNYSMPWCGRLRAFTCKMIMTS